MRAVRCIEGRPTVVDVEPSKGEGIRVRVASAGICGSDLHLMEMGLPLTFGHEIAGTLPDGTPVAIEPLAPCGSCEACLDGQYQRCALGPSIVFGVGRDGGMAEEVLTPESSLSRLPASVSPTDGCLVEPLAVAVHGVRRGGIRPTDRVAVIGGGTIGQMALVVSQAVGASVDLTARHDRQREAASRLGAGEVTDGGYDIVIEAAGTASALTEAVNRCRSGGTVVLLGSYWDGSIEMPGLSVTMREIDVAASILAARPELPDEVITHRFPLDAGAEAFAVAADRSAGSIKVVLEP